jgi:hypothetical protein
MKTFIKRLLREGLEDYEPKRWAYVGKPMNIQSYRGEGNGPESTSKIIFYTTNDLVAQTYGKVQEKMLHLDRPFIWEFNNPIEFNEREVVQLISQFEEALIHINETGTDYTFHRFGESYVIPKDIDGIIVSNIVDTSDGRVDVEDEFSDEFSEQMDLYNSEIILLYRF